jgi:hypothetical protein
MQDFLLDENHNLSGMDGDSVGQHLQVNYLLLILQSSYLHLSSDYLAFFLH